MAFTIADFHDLIRLLEEHPEWRAELRRFILPQELLDLPMLVSQLAQAQAQTDQQLRALVQTVDALVAEMREVRRELTGFKTDLEHLKVEVRGIKTDIGQLKGEALERHYREFGPAYFAPVLRKPRVLGRAALADLLDAAVDEGRITEEEEKEVLWTDVILTGQRRPDRQPVYAAVEISAVIDMHDVSRAQSRALTLQKLGRPVIPVVAGHSVLPDADAAAQAGGIWRVLNGTSTPPS